MLKCLSIGALSKKPKRKALTHKDGYSWLVVQALDEESTFSETGWRPLLLCINGSRTWEFHSRERYNPREFTEPHHQSLTFNLYNIHSLPWWPFNFRKKARFPIYHLMNEFHQTCLWASLQYNFPSFRPPLPSNDIDQQKEFPQGCCWLQLHLMGKRERNQQEWWFPFLFHHHSSHCYHSIFIKCFTERKNTRKREGTWKWLRLWKWRYGVCFPCIIKVNVVECSILLIRLIILNL